MLQHDRWTTEKALTLYRGVALGNPGDFSERFGWAARFDGDVAFSDAEMDAIYDEIIAKIPAGATKVLELGCGDGRFAGRLRAANGTIGYRGVDIVPENVSAAQAALPAEEFVIGNAAEYLMEATADWDFVVSIGCLFHCTDNKRAALIFDLLDAKAPKGFFVLADVAHATPAFLTEKMAEALGTSTNAADSYYEGARAFLDATAALKDVMHPFYVHRDDTTAEVPESIPAVLCLIGVRTDTFNKVLARQDSRIEAVQGNPKPANYTAITVSGGLVSGTSSTAVPTEWVDDIKVRNVGG